MINPWASSITRVMGAMAAVIGLAGPIAAFAQSPDAFPSRAIRLIVPQPPGTGGDIAARLMAEQFKLDLGPSVVVDNRSGANGMIAMAYLAKQPADGCKGAFRTCRKAQGLSWIDPASTWTHRCESPAISDQGAIRQTMDLRQGVDRIPQEIDHSES